jgi:pimeloyl-ACP methyl ester carboxylesterase
MQSVPQLETGQVENAGHMLHHDQPEQVAALIERFIH